MFWSNSSHMCFGADTNAYCLNSPALSFIDILREHVSLKYLVVFSPKSFTKSISLILGFTFSIYNLLTFFSCFCFDWLFYAYLCLLYFLYLLLHFGHYSQVMMTRILVICLSLSASILNLIVSLELLFESLVMTL